MGMDLTVTCSQGRLPPWQQVAAEVARRGLAVQMRMIDGELALPDEQPPENWQELRVAWSGAMVTLRRAADRITVVAWSTTDPAVLRLWQTLAWAIAHTGQGVVHAAEGEVDAATFARHAENGVQPG